MKRAADNGKTKVPRVRVAAMVLDDDKLLMVKHRKAGREYWMLPGGGVNFGENLEEALIREFREEIQIDIDPKALVLVNDSIPPDAHRHIINLVFTADWISGTPELGDDPRIVAVEFILINRLPKLTMFPAVGKELHAILQNPDAGQIRYLGNLWQD